MKEAAVPETGEIAPVIEEESFDYDDLESLPPMEGEEAPEAPPPAPEEQPPKPEVKPKKVVRKKVVKKVKKR